MPTIEENLAANGLTLPEAAAPVANYVPWVVSGNMVFISGQISASPSGLIEGKLGDTMSVEEGQAAALLCGLNLLAQVKAACGGDLSRVRRCVRLGGFVNCTGNFTDHPKVINGASDLMVLAMGEAGRHSRAAVGAPSLPLGAAVEIDAVFEIDA